MSLESEVREPSMRDNFTDGENPEITINPGMFIPIVDEYSIGNYGEEPIKISIRIVGSRKLIGFHK